MSTSGTSGIISQLADYLTTVQSTQQNTNTANTEGSSALMSAMQADTVSISSEAYAKNQYFVERNVTEMTAEDLSYLDAYKSLAATQLSLKNSMNQSLESNLESIAQAGFWYGSQQMRNAKLLSDLTQSFQGVFSDLKDTIDAQAAAAIAPKDANGDPLDQAAPSASPESVPTGTAQAPAASVDLAAAAQAAAVPSATADASLATDGTVQAADTLPSIDLTV